jgi:hypothetical protein
MKARERKLLAAWHSAIGSLLSILFLSIHARIYVHAFQPLGGRVREENG